MRDPERIPEILALIEQIWRSDPDLRFNQVIYNLQRGYSHENDDMGLVKEVVDESFSKIGFDLFNLEDRSFVEYLKKQAAVSSR